MNLRRILTVSAIAVLIALIITPLRSCSAQEKGIAALEETSKAFSQVAERAIPAVVAIESEKKDKVNNFDRFFSPFDDEFFERFFGPRYRPKQPEEHMQRGQGSGFIISSDGYILTNNHVVENADKITVTLNDGDTMEAEIIGTDPRTDVAVVKIDGKKLPFIEIGDSDSLRIGEWVIAVGNPFGLEATVTVGVVSAKGRGVGITEYDDFIQTDAAINPGNSGGPLLDIQGRAVGINTAIVSRSGGYMGIGFAIPINMAQDVKEQLLTTGTVTRGYLGIRMSYVGDEVAEFLDISKDKGVVVAEVMEDSPADKAGLEQGDIITELNGKPIEGLREFKRDIASIAPGKEAVLTIFRNEKERKIKVELGSLEESAFAMGPGSPSKHAEKLGLQVQKLTEDIAKQLGYSTDAGVLVSEVLPGSSAAKAGIKPGMVVVSVNNKKIGDLEDFNKAIQESAGKGKVLMLVKDGPLAKYVVLKIDEEDD